MQRGRSAVANRDPRALRLEAHYVDNSTAGGVEFFRHVERARHLAGRAARGCAALSRHDRCSPPSTAVAAKGEAMRSRNLISIATGASVLAALWWATGSWAHPKTTAG